MDIKLPKIIFGSSALGNLYEWVSYEKKLAIVENWIRHQSSLTVIDSAGKYGAGLSLESIGKCLKALGVSPERVLISNKLGWKRVPLTTPEPTFDHGLWIGIENDVLECMGYDGIYECYEQGNEILDDYEAKLLSVHDPDEFIARAKTPDEAEQSYQAVLDGYRALAELRESGKALGIGIGSKDWRLIKRLFDDGVPFDWVMFANCCTLYSHPEDLREYMEQLRQAGVAMINSAVFNAGFLIGGKWFDYRQVTREEKPELFDWRDRFFRICDEYGISPALACCQFALNVPGVVSLALNTSRPERVGDNVGFANNVVPESFWRALKENELLEADYAYL